MLGQRRRRWPNIEPVHGQQLVFPVTEMMHEFTWNDSISKSCGALVIRLCGLQSVHDKWKQVTYVQFWENHWFVTVV